MVLIPSLLDETLNRDAIVNEFGRAVSGRSHGVVALTPSFNKADAPFWEKCGAAIAKKETIYDQIEALKAGNYDRPLVIANRYDGIDLPDQACRILVFDSRPFFESLLDRYVEGCIGDTDVIAKKAARRIEQGLGRSVRGEKDYSVVILTGTDLVRLIRSKETRRHFSQQTQAQIELGLAIADLARADVAGGEEPMRALHSLIGQCLGRDAGWKEAYRERMDAIRPERPEKHALDVFEAELRVELKYQEGKPDDAVRIVQKLIDTNVHDDAQRG